LFLFFISFLGIFKDFYVLIDVLNKIYIEKNIYQQTKIFKYIIIFKIMKTSELIDRFIVINKLERGKVGEEASAVSNAEYCV